MGDNPFQRTFQIADVEVSSLDAIHTAIMSSSTEKFAACLFKQAWGVCFQDGDSRLIVGLADVNGESPIEIVEKPFLLWREFQTAACPT